MMPVPLVLMGAGGFARETVELVRQCNAARSSWDLLGLLDDDPRLHGTERGGLPVLGPASWLDDHLDVHVTVCLGSPQSVGLRRQVVERLAVSQDRFATLIHPTAVLAGTVEVGVGSVVHALTVCTADVRIGRHVEIMPSVVLTHDDVVEDFATIGAGARIAGAVRIEEEAYVGSGACVREGLTIGRRARLGMGAVLTRSVPGGETWVGSPAAPLGGA